jgi:hypothetical protein
MTILNTNIRTFLQAKDSLADEVTEFLGIHFMSRRGFPPFWILFLVYIYISCLCEIYESWFLPYRFIFWFHLSSFVPCNRPLLINSLFLYSTVIEAAEFDSFVDIVCNIDLKGKKKRLLGSI